MTQPTETWDSGEPLERYVGRWSRLVAREFLAWVRVPAGRRWLDVGCGTGALAQTILQVAVPAYVEGVDASAGYVAFTRTHIHDPKLAFRVADAQALPSWDVPFDVAVSGLLINFVPQRERAVAEMARVTRPGGVVAAYVWDYAGKMELMRHFWDAAAVLDPAARDLDEGRRFTICQPTPLTQLFRGAGLRDVEVRAIDVPTVFRDFDDYWSPFLGGQGPAPGYAMSLPEDRRAALRDRIRASLPIAPGGTIHLIARAWAVRGVHP